jgi:hypothetical protein
VKSIFAIIASNTVVVSSGATAGRANPVGPEDSFCLGEMKRLDLTSMPIERASAGWWIAGERSAQRRHVSPGFQADKGPGEAGTPGETCLVRQTKTLNDSPPRAAGIPDSTLEEAVSTVEVVAVEANMHRLQGQAVVDNLISHRLTDAVARYRTRGEPPPPAPSIPTPEQSPASMC